mmetsp:Transcript_13548/g.15506  ORF Transcript_13548/g.15506 Transcript_13548/m.15506 type:complete len:81 (+) Transcript_13548:687-929(+)
MNVQKYAAMAQEEVKQHCDTVMAEHLLAFVANATSETTVGGGDHSQLHWAMQSTTMTWSLGRDAMRVCYCRSLLKRAKLE